VQVEPGQFGRGRGCRIDHRAVSGDRRTVDARSREPPREGGPGRPCVDPYSLSVAAYKGTPERCACAARHVTFWNICPGANGRVSIGNAPERDHSLSGGERDTDGRANAVVALAGRGWHVSRRMCLSQVFAPSVFVLALAQRRHARVVHRIQPAHLGETPFRHRTARRCARRCRRT
jgi:hypothetical protein